MGTSQAETEKADDKPESGRPLSLGVNYSHFFFPSPRAQPKITKCGLVTSWVIKDCKVVQVLTPMYVIQVSNDLTRHIYY